MDNLEKFTSGDDVASSLMINARRYGLAQYHQAVDITRGMIETIRAQRAAINLPADCGVDPIALERLERIEGSIYSHVDSKCKQCELNLTTWTDTQMIAAQLYGRTSGYITSSLKYNRLSREQRAYLTGLLTLDKTLRDYDMKAQAEKVAKQRQREEQCKQTEQPAPLEQDNDSFDDIIGRIVGNLNI